MSEKVAFDLVSPDRLLKSVDVDMVVVPGADGDFAVLPGHAPMVSTLRPGVVEVHEGTETEDIFVRGGFVEVSGGRLTLLAEEAIMIADLQRTDLEQQITNAGEDLQDAKDDETARKAQDEIDHLTQLLEAL